MNVLFVHQNFPGQFKHLASALAARPEHRVVALHMNPVQPMPGIETVAVATGKPPAPAIHPWVADIESKVIRGEAVYRAARGLKASGFTPDVIVAHPGWGETLFLLDVWPKSPQGLYCEYYYNAVGADVNFDPEFGFEEDTASRLRMKNAVFDMQLPGMAAGISPTRWQRSTYPPQVRSSISVIHDGIDTGLIVPNKNIGLNLRKDGEPLSLRTGDEVITFVARNLEPYRGFHTFMRALPEILRRRPKAQVLIVGGDDVSYGPRPSGTKYPSDKSWKSIFLDEVRSALDLKRVHFFGRLPYQQYLAVLQISTVHVYLTYPFVLSWSLLEAMSAGCAIVGSDTPPVAEAIRDGKTGKLVDFFDHRSLSDAVCDLCNSPGARYRLGEAARKHAIEHYDLRTFCLPAQMAWVSALAG